MLLLSASPYFVQVLIRSIPLRGFDQQMSEHVVEFMEEENIAFHRGATPTAVELLDDGKRRVTWKQQLLARDSEGSWYPLGPEQTCVEDFDTVLLAIGRDAYTHKMGLGKAGVERNPLNGKIPVRNEQTNVPHIFAIGDIVDGSALSPPSSLYVASGSNPV